MVASSESAKAVGEEEIGDEGEQDLPREDCTSIAGSTGTNDGKEQAEAAQEELRDLEEGEAVEGGEKEGSTTRGQAAPRGPGTATAG